MSEAELIEALQGYIGESNTILFGFVSLVSAFLALSYLVADKLSRAMAAIVLGLFTVTSSLFVFRLFLLRTDLAALFAHIAQGQASGELDLPWFGLTPEWSPRVNGYLELAATMGSFVACVVFFVYQRRSHRGGLRSEQGVDRGQSR